MSRPNLILLHGALGSEEQLVPLAELLEDKFNTHLFTFSGHGGKSFNQAGFSVKVFMDEVDAFMQENGLDSAYFFGYSMGGYVALYLATYKPHRVSGIFTLATKLNWTPETAKQETKQLNSEIIEEKIPKFAELLRQRHQPNDWKEVLQKTAELMLDLGNENALTESELSHITCPVTVSVGSLDNMVSTEETKWASNAISQAKFKLFGGFKHPIEQVDMNLLAKAIKEELA